jgi:outer membrane protein TolC
VDNQESRVGQLADRGLVGVELSIPIYSGGISTSRVREAEALLRGAETELTRLRSDTERETRQLFRQVQTAYVQVQALARALRSAEAAEQATRNGYEAGTRTISDVLDAQSRTVQARRERNQTRYQLLLSLLQLKQAVGVLNERDFAEIDRLLQPGSPS